MPQKKCERCGASFQARRSTARYCGSSCRSLTAQRKKREAKAGGTVLTLAPRPATPDPDSLTEELPVKPRRRKPGPVEVAVRKELEEAKRLETSLGQTALVMAQRVDLNIGDTGSALASLVREMRATVDAAMIGARPPDELDLLRRRRDRKLGSG